MDVNATVYCGDDAETIKLLQTNGTKNLKRIRIYSSINWTSDKGQSPYFINDIQETKTTWHAAPALREATSPCLVWGPVKRAPITHFQIRGWVEQTSGMRIYLEWWSLYHIISIP